MGQIHGKSGGILSGPSPFDSLPEECISNIISFTSPQDACVVACVSKTFESAAKSDIVWERFLPLDYMVPRCRDISSKKEIYFALREEPVLIEDDKMSSWLEKENRKKCIMLSAMSMSITWGDNPIFWQWIQIHESRFEKVAVLRDVSWFEIRGRINTSFLSPRTRYTVYIVFKKTNRFRGFEYEALEARVGVVGKKASKRFICFDASTDEKYVRGALCKKITKPDEREDGWMEIELGEFFYKGGLMNSKDIEMCVLSTKRIYWKSGLIIQGMEIRPSKFFVM